MAQRMPAGKLCGGIRAWIEIACCWGLALTLLGGFKTSAHDELKITASFTDKAAVTPETNIELTLSRSVSASEGRLAIVIANADLTSLFIAPEKRFVYSATLAPLPLGESPLVVYLVSQDQTWREVARFVLQVVKEKETQVPTPNAFPANDPAEQRDTNGSSADADLLPAATNSSTVPTRSPRVLGLEKMNLAPSLSIGAESQPAQLNFPSESRPPERATFTDVTLQSSLRLEAAGGPFASGAQFDFAGSSFQPAALRFGSLGKSAPNIDLASYLMQFRIGRARLAVGNTSFGAARQLVSSFSSRGITITVPITRRLDITAAAMNGTSIVGYGNFFGLNTRKHQLAGASLGVELLPERPGGLRLEFGLMKAELQPLNGFSQGNINDVEQSRGHSLRLIFSDKGERLRFDGGLARSQYGNPADPLAAQNSNTRFGTATFTRNANYFDLSYAVLRNFAVTRGEHANLNVTVRHEQVDPLYRSLGASTQADRRQDELLISGTLGEIQVQAGLLRSHDNLLRVPTILQSLARVANFSVALPAALLLGRAANASPFLPRLSYSIDRRHLFGRSFSSSDEVPGDIDPSSIPDQFLTQQALSAEWQIKKLTVGSNYTRSFANNEQPGHQHSDLLYQTNTARVGFSPLTTLKLNVDLSWECTHDLERAMRFRTWQVGTTGTWDLNKRMTWTAGVSNTIAGDQARTNSSRNTELNTELVYRAGFERGGLRKAQAQMSVRYADRYARNYDVLFGSANRLRAQIMTVRLSVTFF